MVVVEIPLKGLLHYLEDVVSFVNNTEVYVLNGYTTLQHRRFVLVDGNFATQNEDGEIKRLSVGQAVVDAISKNDMLIDTCRSNEEKESLLVDRGVLLSLFDKCVHP